MGKEVVLHQMLGKWRRWAIGLIVSFGVSLAIALILSLFIDIPFFVALVTALILAFPMYFAWTFGAREFISTGPRSRP